MRSLVLLLFLAARAEDVHDGDPSCRNGGECSDDGAALLVLKHSRVDEKVFEDDTLTEKEDISLETVELVEAVRQAKDEAEAEAGNVQGQAPTDSDAVLLRTTKQKSPFTLAGKSMYFLLTDRFARSGHGPLGQQNTTFCDLDSHGVGGYCGGTFRGIISKLPYIKGMGFDCIWISPPVEAQDYTGYFATNFYKVNPHWGTQHDFKLLSSYMHKLNMCLVVDIVTNHVRSLLRQDGTTPAVHGNYVPVVPFSHASHYHQLEKKPGDSFRQYVLQPPPNSSSGSGNTSALQAGVEAGKFSCGPDVPELTYCNCFPGNRAPPCPGYSAELQLEGWFGSLADLNQSVPFVRSGLKKFAVGLRDTFGVDAIRLDTAIYQGRRWLRKLQEAVGIEILGEATVVNLTYAGTFQRHEGKQVLKGLLNFPPFYWMPRAFCNYYLLAPFGQYATYQGTWASGTPNLTQVSAVINAQQTGGFYDNLDLLGNFADNHDEFSRLGWYCQQDSQRIKNLLALVFFMRGIPIIYYGTEQGLLGHQLTKEESKNYTIPTGQFKIRESIWQTKYDTSAWQYKFIRKLNLVRKLYKFGVGKMKILNMTTRKLVFTRKQASPSTKGAVWAFLNNFDNTTQGAVKYCPGPDPAKGHKWYDALSLKEATLHGGCYVASDALPKLLVQKW